MQNSTSDPQVSADEIATFIALAKRLLWAPPALRKQIEQAGLTLVPCNFYSTIPSLSEIENSFEDNSSQNLPVYLRKFEDEKILPYLESISTYAAEFSPKLEESEAGPTSFFWNNSQFSNSDAMAYYSVVRHRKPHRIVEIGSGFSTLIALEAIRRNGFGEIVCIEPYPRDFLTKLPRVRVDTRKIQSIPVDGFLEIMSGAELLFVDSTHTVKMGSDCLYIYLNLLPAIQNKILLHAHDIFLPFGMPGEWARKHHIYWTEQYLLYAYLLDNPYATIKFSSAYLEHFHRAKLEKFMEGKYRSGGGSIWIEIERNKSPGDLES